MIDLVESKDWERWEKIGHNYPCDFEIRAGDVLKISSRISARTQMYYFALIMRGN